MAQPTKDRDLVRLYWPPDLRPAFDALFAIEDAMAEVMAGASQPALAAIKLAWWREALEKLDSQSAPAEPRLRAAAGEVLPRGVKGVELGRLEEGWAALLSEQPDPQAVLERGAVLFGLGARLLGGDESPGLAAAGRLYVASQLLRRGRSPAGLDVPSHFPKMPRALRPLTGLAALARRDLGATIEPEATPGRAWTLLRHRLTGR
ncbi:hypothetical protein ACFQPG_10660 [Sphingomonas sp. GCM10030256]|uniref:hypothetical protein n=1 Tax=Sphingomonas sp. GCM10030256 TaxID=3273427 RepID=UPI003615FE0D